MKLYRANREAIFYLNQMAENANENETIVTLDQIRKEMKETQKRIEELSSFVEELEGMAKKEK